MVLLIALFDSLLLLGALVSGLFCLIQEYAPDMLEVYLADWVYPISPYSVFAMFFFGTALLAMLMRWMRMTTTNDLYFTTNRGNSVQISNKALTDFVKEAIQMYLDDMEDAEEAMQRLSDPDAKYLSTEELLKSLDV